MKHLLIIGARGYGRIACDIARTMSGYGFEFDIKGYLDDKKDALEGFNDYPKIIDSVENYKAKIDDVFVCALGDVIAKKKYIEIMNKQCVEWFTIVHPSTIISQSAHIGNGCIFSQNVVVDSGANLNDYVCVQSQSVIGHDANVGAFCMIDSFCFMGGCSELEESVTLHTHSTIIPKIKVGSNSVINACSLVIRNVKPSSIMMGNPAREIFAPSK